MVNMTFQGNLVFNTPLPTGSVLVIIEFAHTFKVLQIRPDGTRKNRSTYSKPLFNLREVIDRSKKEARYWDMPIEFFRDHLPEGSD